MNLRSEVQLKGRTSRAGDPGSSQLHVSLDEKFLQTAINPNLLRFFANSFPEILIKYLKQRMAIQRNALENLEFENRKALHLFEKV